MDWNYYYVVACGAEWEVKYFGQRQDHKFGTQESAVRSPRGPQRYCSTPHVARPACGSREPIIFGTTRMFSVPPRSWLSTDFMGALPA